MRRFLACLLMFVASQSGISRADDQLETQLRALSANYAGNVALYAIDIKSGRTVGIDPDTPVPTASTIKLAILFEALKAIEAGDAHWDDRLTLTPENQVEGSGVLNLFDTPLALTFKDVLTMMIVQSDNTATNMAIDHLGLARIDERIRWLGFRDTWLYKKVFKPPTGNVPADQPKFGLGKTTAREMTELMQRFATCDLNRPGDAVPPTPKQQALCDTALAMLKNQSDRGGIPRYLGALTVANKTGALDAARNDVGIIYAPRGPIVMAAFTYDNHDQSWTPDNAGQLLIAKMAKTIVDAWN
jgi:beta-lactamase class A